MSKCFVKRLKATVSNPNLPVLETMQQFTLDVIAASGNTTMTDTQKWALNHFFYSIGAIGNTALWEKVQLLILPMIASSVDNALKEYRAGRNLTATTTSDLSIVNGGLQSTNGTKTFQVSNVSGLVEKSGDTALLLAGSPTSGILYNNADAFSAVLEYTYSDSSTSSKRFQAASSYLSMQVLSGQNFVKRYNGAARNAMLAMLNAKKPYDDTDGSNFEQLMFNGNGDPISYTAATLHQGTDTFVDTSEKTVSGVGVKLTVGGVAGIMIGFNSILTEAEKNSLIPATLRLLNSFAA